MKKTSVEEFIEFVKSQYGVTVSAKVSSTPDSFERIFGYSFSNEVFSENMSELGTYISIACQIDSDFPEAIFPDVYEPVLAA